MMEYSVAREEYDHVVSALKEIRVVAEEGVSFHNPVILQTYLIEIQNIATKGLEPFNKPKEVLGGSSRME